MRQVALFGGSFNPPHVGHLLAAHFVKACLEVDEVWLLPTYRHPFGKALTAFEHRMNMATLLCADAGGWLSAKPFEKDVGGEGWTVDTLEHLVGRFPQHRFHWIIGSDIVADLPRWRAFDRIQQLAKVQLLNRAGHPAEGALGPPMAEVSSSEIRERMARGESLLGLVPASVERYLHQHSLFPES